VRGELQQRLEQRNRGASGRTHLIERVNRLFYFQLKSKELHGLRRPHRNFFNDQGRGSTVVNLPPSGPAHPSPFPAVPEALSSCALVRNTPSFE
jgi:hypothetical protein